jgi:hypothetical protein
LHMPVVFSSSSSSASSSWSVFLPLFCFKHCTCMMSL